MGSCLQDKSQTSPDNLIFYIADCVWVKPTRYNVSMSELQDVFFNFGQTGAASLCFH